MAPYRFRLAHNKYLSIIGAPNLPCTKADKRPQVAITQTGSFLVLALLSTFSQVDTIPRRLCCFPSHISGIHTAKLRSLPRCPVTALTITRAYATLHIVFEDLTLPSWIVRTFQP